jgi:hypothetical protein
MSDYDKTHILHPANRKAFIDSILDLYDTHGETIDKSVEKNDRKQRSVIFSVVINKSGALPEFSPKMRMVTVDPLKDQRRVQAEDPDAVPMPGSFTDEVEKNSKEALKNKREKPNLSMAESPKKKGKK